MGGSLVGRVKVEGSILNFETKGYARSEFEKNN